MDFRRDFRFVKDVVRSLVASCPCQTIKQLVDNYFYLTGFSMPFLKLEDVELFLRTIPDTVSVLGYGLGALVVGVPSARSQSVPFYYCQQQVQMQIYKTFQNHYFATHIFPQYNFNKWSIKQGRPHRGALNLNGFSPRGIQNKLLKSAYEPKTLEQNRHPALESAVATVDLVEEDDQNTPKTQNLYSAEAKPPQEPVVDAKELEANLRNLKVNQSSLSDYPELCVHSEFKLPARDVESTLNLEERFEVQVVKVDSPHSFKMWIYDEMIPKYWEMSCNMQTTLPTWCWWIR
ncbi:uncharacterized protein LOC127011025 [Drosophila biarmipes]|uniref:uncharacterized protein LOC127011025 n=1 Tax=Drosophila biarmipes TaxID=125945 RepID=UPI0021CCABB0|nr:uncharacterized protein LOC127011025 [Drosophila biarmipes]